MIGGEKLLWKDDPEHNDNIGEVLSDFSVKESKVVIIDADSLIYICAHPGKDVYGDKIPDYTEEEFHLAEEILTEYIYSIINKVEEYFDVERFYICLKGRKNFRYNLFPDYKSKRPPSPSIIGHLVDYLEREFHAIRAHGYEADDLVYSISEMIEHKGIICCVDKDLYQIPSVFFNYQKNTWKKVDPQTARYNFAVQMIIGDSGDGVNLTPKHGIKYAEKVLVPGMCDFAYLRQIVIVFQKCWGGEWKEKLKLAYDLLRLHSVNMDEISAQRKIA